MSYEIQLLNSYFPWKICMIKNSKCFFKGNVFLDNEYISPKKLFYILDDILVDYSEDKFAELIRLFNNLNGNFALIIEFRDEIICAVDKIRSIPIFYSNKEDNLVISDDAHYIKKQIKPELDEKNAAEFLITGYVTGQNTLFEDIKQLQAGEILVYDKAKCSLNTSSYFRFLYKDPWDLDEDTLLDKLDDCFVNVFNRLIESTVKQGLQIVVPLSGGLDSRIIVAMLKRLDIDNVICYSYGKKNDPELKISKKIAESLGYKWYFVEYTDDKWNKCFQSMDFEYFEEYGSNLSSLYHIQDLLAVMELKEKGFLPENAVFIPGHSGDMLAGSHIPAGHLNNSRGHTFESFINEIFKKHYDLWDYRNDSSLKAHFEDNIKRCVGNMEINDAESCANAIELFNFQERQGKFIVNSIRNYELFGYEWRIPLWDSELIDFFLMIPIKYRVRQEIYKNYSRCMLFVDDLEQLRKIDCTTKLENKNTMFSGFYDNVNIYYMVVKNRLFGTWSKDFKRFEAKYINKIYTQKRILIEDKSILKSIMDYNNPHHFNNINSPLTLLYLFKIIESIEYEKT